MYYLHEVSINWHDAYFIDLLVRPSNRIAVNFYKMFGYDVYRKVANYYGGDPSSPNEDAYDMLISLPKESNGIISIPTDKIIQPNCQKHDLQLE